MITLVYSRPLVMACPLRNSSDHQKCGHCEFHDHRNKNGRPKAPVSPYSLPTLERIADAEGEVFRIRAGKERLGAIVVVRRRYTVPQERTDRVNEGLPIEAPARAHVPLRSPQAGGAAGARSERAVALACADELRRKAPRAEAAIPT